MHALVEEDEDEDEDGDGEESEYACIKGLIIEPGPPKPPASRSGGGGGGGGGGGASQVNGVSVSPQRSASSRTASSSSASASAGPPPVLGPRMGPPMGAQKSMHAKSFTQVDKRPSSMRVATVRVLKCLFSAALAACCSEFTSSSLLLFDFFPFVQG